MPPGGYIITAPSMRFRGGINVRLARLSVRKSNLIAQKAINTRNFGAAPGHHYSRGLYFERSLQPQSYYRNVFPQPIVISTTTTNGPLSFFLPMKKVSPIDIDSLSTNSDSTSSWFVEKLSPKSKPSQSGLESFYENLFQQMR